MLARVRSGALIGIDAVIVDVEVDMALGLPYFNVVGLPEGAVRESKVRVVSALKNTGFDLPQKRITVNLAPADIRKEGAAFELPIALGVLVASRFLDEDALELAAAGGHNVLMCGPPGSGKTMLARRLPSILPTMEFQEALEITKIYSVLGLLRDGQAMIAERPFRSPHHTISDAGLVGGGPMTRPGELSMAHHGVLFLDELPEFRKNVLEVLRQPLEEGQVHLARANQNVTYPCRVMLVAAMNPCPCGYFNVPGRACTCAQFRILDYHARVSGPLLDRIDITLQTLPVEYRRIAARRGSELPSSHYRERVEAARERQRHRFRFEPGVYCNAQMAPATVRSHCEMSPRAELESHEQIEDVDMQLAIDCRMLDRRGWFSATASSMERNNQTYVSKLLDEPPPSQAADGFSSSGRT